MISRCSDFSKVLTTSLEHFGNSECAIYWSIRELHRLKLRLCVTENAIDTDTLEGRKALGRLLKQYTPKDGGE